MVRTYHETSTGRQVADSVAVDERGNIKSGYTLRVHSTMIDGRTDPASYDPQAGAKDYSHVDRYRRDISDAWRNPDAPFVAVKAQDAPSTASAYERYDRQIADAWR